MGTTTQKREYWQLISKDGASDQCFLFTDAFGRVLQLLLAVAAVLILYIKRKLETPARPLKTRHFLNHRQVWAMDVSKQCVGSLICHCLNIVFSIIFVASAASDDDECGVYFVTYLVDGTLGLALVIVFLRSVHRFAVKFGVQDLIDSGYYGEPPRWRIWWIQLSGYMTALLLMKLVDFLFMWCLYRPLVSASNALFAGFSSHRHFELLLVMVILPGVFNSFQFWILDSQLKCSGERWKYYAQPGSQGEKNWMYQSSQSSTNPPILGFSASVHFPEGADQTREKTEPNLAIPL